MPPVEASTVSRMTGGFPFNSLSNSETVLTAAALPSIPILTALIEISVEMLLNCSVMHVLSKGYIVLTPVVFWAVTAVMTDNP